MTPEEIESLAIIGGGIAGIALAVALQHRNIPVRVYEAGPDFTELGAGMGIGPNAVASLQIISPAAAEVFERLATKNSAPGEEATWMNFRYGMDVGNGQREGQGIAKVVTRDERKTGISSVHRARFLCGLAGLVDKGAVEFNRKCVKVEDAEDGKIRVLFEDGTVVLAPAVVGCDGLRSCVRQYVLGLTHPLDKTVYTKKYAYRGLVPMDKAIEGIGEELALNSQYYLGVRGHVISYPVDGGKYLNVAAFHDDEEDEWKHPTWAVKERGDEMRRNFEGWGKPVRTLTQIFGNPDKFANFAHEPAPTYVKGTVALLGDAAHAMTPHQGAGAGQALEDAAFLGAILEKAKAKGVGFQEAFRVYDAVRRPRSQGVAATSLESGKTLAMTGPAGTDHEKIREDLLNRWNWIWEYDVGKGIEEALGQL